MRKSIMLLLAFGTFAPAAAFFGLMLNTNPIVGMAGFTALATILYQIEKRTLPEGETLFSWTKKQLN